MSILKVNNKKKITDRLVGLELIRFISAFSILIWHYQHFTFLGDKAVNFNRNEQPFYEFLSVFYDHGLFGVQIFWCISGFIFFWKYRDIISEKSIQAKQFFLLRFSRLYPLHFLTLFIVVFLQLIYLKQNSLFLVYQNNDLYHFFLQIFFISDWGFENGYSFNGPIWSISVEIMVYIFFFITLKYIGRSILINFLIIFICVFIQISEILHYPIVLNCLSLFYAGGIAAIIFKNLKNKKYNKFINIFLIFLIIAIPFCIHFFKLYTLDYWLVIAMLIYVPIILFIFSQDFIKNKFICNIIKIFGNMTYSSYLIHFPLQFSIILILSYLDINIPFYSNYFLLFYLGLVLSISYLIYYYFELPIQNKIRDYLNI